MCVEPSTLHTGNNSNVVINKHGVKHAVAESVNNFNRSRSGNNNHVTVGSSPSESNVKPIIADSDNVVINRSCRH